MLGRINNKTPNFPSVDELNPEQAAPKSTRAESKKSGLITEIGIPGNDVRSPASPESTSIAAEEKNAMNMRAGFLQKSLNGQLSRQNTNSAALDDLNDFFGTKVKPLETSDGTTSNVVESVNVKYTMLKPEKQPGKYTGD